MATVTYTGPYQYRSDHFDLSLLDEAVRYEHSPTTFRAITISSGKYWIELQGTDFTYSPSGLPVSGTVTGFTSIDKGGANIVVTGLNASVSKFVTVAATGRSPDDDLKLYKSILSGSDVIRGGRSTDRIEGFSGNDTLIGGGSSDMLWGGKGADRFVFESVKDSRNIGRGADFIEDFSRAQGDKIDLSKIDAKTGLAGNQAFHFIGTKEFTGVKGQLRYEEFAFDVDGNGPQRWVSIQADTNGNGIADLEISAVVVGSIAKSCFIL